jgi:hypothetical protein
VGPNRCIMCKLGEKLVNKLFTSFSFFRVVWLEITQDLGVKGKWDNGTLEESTLEWVIDKVVTTHKALPCMFTYGIWTTNNQMNFEDLDFTLAQATHKIRVALEGNNRALKKKNSRIY